MRMTCQLLKHSKYGRLRLTGSLDHRVLVRQATDQKDLLSNAPSFNAIRRHPGASVRRGATSLEHVSMGSLLSRRVEQSVTTLGRHIIHLFLALLVLFCLSLGAKDVLSSSGEVLMNLQVEKIQQVSPDGSIRVQQTIQRLTRTGSPLEQLKRLVDELETNQERDAATVRLLDELEAADTLERSSSIVQLIWRTWLFHEVDDIRELVQVGADVLAHGGLQGAECCFLEAISRDPEYVEAWHQLAQVHFLMGNNAKALADVQNTLFLEPRHFSALRIQSLLLMKLNFVDESADAMQKADEVSPMLRDLDLRACFVKSLRQEVDARAPKSTSLCEVLSC